MEKSVVDYEMVLKREKKQSSSPLDRFGQWCEPLCQQTATKVCYFGPPASYDGGAWRGESSASSGVGT